MKPVVHREPRTVAEAIDIVANYFRDHHGLCQLAPTLSDELFVEDRRNKKLRCSPCETGQRQNVEYRVLLVPIEIYW
jgi:hypothetical protein